MLQKVSAVKMNWFKVVQRGWLGSRGRIANPLLNETQGEMADIKVVLSLLEKNKKKTSL